MTSFDRRLYVSMQDTISRKGKFRHAILEMLTTRNWQAMNYLGMSTAMVVVLIQFNVLLECRYGKEGTNATVANPTRAVDHGAPHSACLKNLPRHQLCIPKLNP